MEIRGNAHKLRDNISTDDIISGKYKFNTLDMEELKKHLLESIAPGFINKIKKNDILVGGDNFGCGSSREQAPRVIIAAGISAILASSFARIFYRNAINLGLPAIIMPTAWIKDGDELIINLKEGTVYNNTQKELRYFNPFPKFLLNILEAGGIVEYLKKGGVF
jgi:3-isopropylmalate/(R)-2-methylmalate dehydratase small subunit